MRGKRERGGERKTFLLPFLLTTEAISVMRKREEREGKRESERERERERENVGREGERGKKKEIGRKWRRKGDMFPIILIISCIFISARGINVII